jgi:thiol:disulfide interchange protein DsbD
MNAVLTFPQIESPVKWSYTAIKKEGSIYEVVLTAIIFKPWHIYSQNMQECGPVPTKITFAKNL